MKVVQLVEGHNFHVDWHFKFGVGKGEKLAQMTAPPVHWIWVAFKVDKPFVQNLMRKPHITFVKVVGGIEIYNFRIESFVHVHTNFGVFQFRTVDKQHV
jgi:hypothetical protein